MGRTQPNSFSQEDRELVRGPQGRPPLRAKVSIAAYSLDEPNATRYTRGLGRVEHKGQPFMDLYVHTMDNDTLMEYNGANNLDPG